MSTEIIQIVIVGRPVVPRTLRSGESCFLCTLRSEEYSCEKHCYYYKINVSVLDLHQMTLKMHEHRFTVHLFLYREAAVTLILIEIVATGSVPA